MLTCRVCGAGFQGVDELESHFAGHAVLPIKDRPLSYMLVLPDGVTPGRSGAADAFADAFLELHRMHPGTRFHFVPFSFDATFNPTLGAILAVAPESGMFTNPEKVQVEWYCGYVHPLGPGWVDQNPECALGVAKCWHRLLPTRE